MTKAILTLILSFLPFAATHAMMQTQNDSQNGTQADDGQQGALTEETGDLMDDDLICDLIARGDLVPTGDLYGDLSRCPPALDCARPLASRPLLCRKLTI